MKILGKVGELGIDEIFIAGIAKQIEERALSPVIGNQTLMSGAVKLGIAMFMPKSNKYMKAVSMGFGIDGVEDIVGSLLSGGIGNIFGGKDTGAEI